MSPQAAPRVFLSYRHESKLHSDAVGELCRRLRGGGIDCHYDQEVIWPEDGWLVWMRRQIAEARFILAICSPQYRLRWEAIRPATDSNVGRGTAFEASLLAQEIYECHGVNKRIIPVVMNGTHAPDVPLELRKYAVFDTSASEQFDHLYGILTGQLEPDFGPVGEIRPPPSSMVRRTFSGLLIGDAEAADPMTLRKRVAASAYSGLANARHLEPYEAHNLAEAVGAGDGPMILFYGPGSGKTILIVNRVMSLVESGVMPTQILVLTATDEDGRHISYRLEGRLPGMFRRMTCGTFCEAAASAIRHEAQSLGRTVGFSVIDETEARALVGQLMGDAPGALAARVIHGIYSYSAHTLLPLDVVLMDRYPWLFWAKEAICAVLSRYDQEKRDRNLVDEEDLLTGWNRLLDEHPDVLANQRAVWRHVIVDQFQDVTRLQSLIVHQLVGEKGGNLLALLDDWQAISSATGSSLANMFALSRLYPTAERLTLEANFRSTPEIVALINRVLASGHSMSGPRALTPARPDSGPKPKVVTFDDSIAQAAWLCDEIESLRAGGRPVGGIAVLYRSRASSLEADVELNRRGIPMASRVHPPMFEQDHIQDVLACLRAAGDNKDLATWMRILRLIPGTSQWTAKSIWNRIVREDEDTVEASLSGAAADSWKALRQTLTAVRAAVRPADKLLCLLDGEFGPFLQAAFDDYGECVADIRRLSAYAGAFETMEMLLKHVQRRQPARAKMIAFNQDGSEQGCEEGPEAVCLAAIADVRSIEFEAVFVLGLAQGEFPSTAACVGPGEEDEERRAFYVAVTRARSLLYLLCPRSVTELSPFLVALEGTFEWLDRTTTRA